MGSRLCRERAPALPVCQRRPTSMRLFAGAVAVPQPKLAVSAFETPRLSGAALNRRETVKSLRGKCNSETTMPALCQWGPATWRKPRAPGCMLLVKQSLILIVCRRIGCRASILP